MGETIADESLRNHIRARLASGDLPHLDGPAWAGEARGEHRCICCHRTIRAREVEYEPRSRPDVYAHITCFTVWLAESRLARATPRRPPAKMPGQSPPPLAEAI